MGEHFIKIEHGQQNATRNPNGKASLSCGRCGHVFISADGTITIDGPVQIDHQCSGTTTGPVS